MTTEPVHSESEGHPWSIDVPDHPLSQQAYVNQH